MVNIRKSLLQFVFSGAFMKRWNDKLRPMELLEIDKQAHKMITAFALLAENGRDLPEDERIRLYVDVVEGGLFEYFYRLVITDIKPPIFYQIKSNPDHYRQLTDWVLTQLEPRILPLGRPFWGRLTGYLADPEPQTPASRILMAAHLYASQWEFNLIKTVNPQDDEFREIDSWFIDRLADYEDLKGVAELRQGVDAPMGRFAHLCGQLRFQKRWSQTPRVPETSVIGHMFIVACYAYFFSLAIETSDARRANNFFAGLFHDLPEMLTRDIISPVKKSLQVIADMIHAYEKQELTRRVLMPLDEGGHTALTERLAYYLGLEVGSEFYATIREDGLIKAVDFGLLQGGLDRNELDPKDGAMLKVCDSLAAFIEAYTALKNGISSDELRGAIWRIRAEYADVVLGPLHLGTLLADFD